jgi:hypothetical protein
MSMTGQTPTPDPTDRPDVTVAVKTTAKKTAAKSATKKTTAKKTAAKTSTKKSTSAPRSETVMTDFRATVQATYTALEKRYHHCYRYAKRWHDECMALEPELEHLRKILEALDETHPKAPPAPEVPEPEPAKATQPEPVTVVGKHAAPHTASQPSSLRTTVSALLRPRHGGRHA